jgi:signal transduction histidine kinase
VTWLRRYGFDTAIVVVALLSALEVALTRHGNRVSETSHWFAVPAVALIVLTLLGRHRFPFAAPAALWVISAAVSFVDGGLVTHTQGLFVAGFAAAFLLGNVRNTERGRVGLAVVLVCAGAIVYNDPDRATGEIIFTPLFFGIGWLVGFALRERAAQAEAAEARATRAEYERETAARIAVAEERARIARELHDIVAHAVSVMVLQVGAVRHKLPAELTEDREALKDVEGAGRAALAEMRRLLGAMRREGDQLDLTPQPGLGNLGPLLDEIRRAGLPVELELDGEPFSLPEAIDLSAYRIVQEGLTNALRHAQATHAQVVLRYLPNEIQIDIEDDGRGPATSDGRGLGLVGVRERVKLYGGEMSAHAVDGRGFLLTTRLPIGVAP